MDHDKLLTHGSLFSGIGGFDLAAEWAGFQNTFHADNNDFCRHALEHQFPTQPPIYHRDDGILRRLAGLPLSYKKWRTEAVKACGNAIVPQVAYEILRVIREVEINS